MIKTIVTLVRSQGLAVLALLLVVSGTGAAAYAAGGVAKKNSVVSKSIRNGEVKTKDLRNGSVSHDKLGLDSVTGDNVAPDTLTGGDVEESSLGQVPNAATLNGSGPGSFLRSSTYVKEVGPLAGTDLGDGTFKLSVTCDPGDLALSGGAANVLGTSDLVESFPSQTTGWSVRIHKNGATDNFSAVVVCANQA